jgi:dihydrofolate reductase
MDMRRITALEFVSLDGVIQAPGGPDEDTSGGFRFGGWTVPYFDEAAGEIMRGQMSRPADLLLGRKTFEIFASYWPEHADGWPGINDMTKYVASRTVSAHSWKNSVFLAGDAATAVRKLKASDGPDLHVYGSGNLLQTLIKHDLVDELWLKIFPVTLGTGKRLFGQGAIGANFRLLEGKVMPSGVIVASYARDGEVKTGSF